MPYGTKVSIVCPALNEEEVLPHFHRELCRVLDTIGDCSFEIIYVDDGSTDRTVSLMREWARQDSRVRYVSLSRNFGHQAAFTAGMECATGDAVILMDSDLQHPPALIPQMLRLWHEGHDLVVTLREGGRPPGLIQLASGCFRWMMRRLSPLRMRKGMGDFTLLSRRVIDQLLQMREAHRYLRGLIQWLGFSVGEVRYTAPERAAGKTRFTILRLVNYALDATVSFSRAPLRLAFVLGFVCLLIGLVSLGFAAWHLASIYLVGGANLMAMGLVGEYVGRTFEQVKGRPLYLVRETEDEVNRAREYDRLVKQRVA